MTPDELRDVLKVDFTDEQLAVIHAPLAPTVVVAGAGSGKTAVMAARVLHLVAEAGVPADQVLGMTFTNKAAAELSRRVADALTVWRRGAGLPDDDAMPTIATYHSYAARLVADHGLRIGVEPAARLLADATRWQLAQRVVRRARGPFTALQRRPVDLVDDVIRLDAELSEHLRSTEELRASDRELVARIDGLPKLTAAVREARETALERIELSTLVDDYRAAKVALDVFDYGDLVVHAARLAETRPEVGAIERERFGVVLLDEYQDTSVAQRRMLTGLFGGGHPVTAVGDPCQSIYGWRGASVSNLDGFPHHFPDAAGRPAATHSLTRNFRSGGRLLGLANALSEPLRAVHRTVPVLRPRDGAETVGETVCALLPAYADEVEWVAEQVRRAVADDGVPPGQIAVLARVTADFPAYYDALGRRGLPVEVVGLSGLLALPEVADVVAMLEVLDDPTANAALVRLLTGPRWRIGPRDLAALGRRAARLAAVHRHAGAGPADDLDDDAAGAGHGARAAAEAGPAGDEPTALERAVAGVDPAEVVALADAIASPGRLDDYSPEAYARLRAFAAELTALRGRMGQQLVELVADVVTTTGLDVELAASREAVAAGRAANVATFLARAAEFSGLEGDASLPAFLAFLKVAEQYDRGLDTEGPSPADAVKLLTVHKAKGLEWDVVAVPSLCRDVFPSRRGRERWPTSHVTLPYPLRGDAADMPAVTEWSRDGLQRFVAECKELSLREERRLAYVAVTRPRRRLIAGGHWWGPSQKRPRGPSPFLDEIRAAAEAGLGRVDGWADEPAVDAVNPVLAEVARHEWPRPFAEPALTLRRESAAAVRAALERGARPPATVVPTPAAPVTAGAVSAGPATAAPASAGPDPGLTETERDVVAGWDADLAVLLGDLREQRLVARPVPLPRSLTASQVVELGRDPDALARAIARPMPRPPAPHARRGTAFHAWVEARFSQRPLLDPDDLPGAGDAAIETDAELAELQAAFEASAWGDRVPVAMEVPFELALGGFVLRGRIDAVYAEPDGRYDVVDYKTGRVPDDLAAAALQLSVYRHAWAGISGVPLEQVRAGFLYVRTGQVLRPDLLDRVALEALLTGRPPGQAALF